MEKQNDGGASKDNFRRSDDERQVINVILPRWLVERLNEAAPRLKQSPSEMITAALKQLLDAPL